MKGVQRDDKRKIGSRNERRETCRQKSMRPRLFEKRIDMWSNSRNSVIIKDGGRRETRRTRGTKKTKANKSEP